ncbi:hypothetical protein C2S52_015080 [Perilla frutescens var. hirtella]|nr:hypothetical protein C2S52_015080 [Perilla frutescens var. hirtella]
MDQIREVARAYYNGADEEERNLARKLFQTLDEDGDGKVTLHEYKKRVNPFFSNEHIFRQLDENDDGTLDFDEVLALYYMDRISIPRCASCHDLLLASYFCCMSCLGKTSYCLCCDCYGGQKFHHPHSSGEFSDTRAMLKLLGRFMAGNATGDEVCDRRDVREGVIGGFKRQASKEALRNIVDSGTEKSISSLASTATENITATVVEAFEDVDLGCSIL